MKVKTCLAVSAALIAFAPNMVAAQDAAPIAADDVAQADGEIIVTARKREETLLDVPVAISAVTGDTLEQRGINSVREAAALTPGLNITSDGSGRAFVAIRGVGVTLVQSVQPGVGLFINGIYQPNTAYLNNPLLDIERVEVLRGPQGTIYGKNTLGGAINVITRQPSNELTARGNFSYSGPDDSFLASASVSGPIITDVLQVRVAAAHRQQDGFLFNTILGRDANPFKTDSINGTIRFAPAGDVVLTVNGYYDWVKGVNTPYSRVDGPTDYSRDIEFNARNRVNYRYRGVSARIEAPIDALNSELTLLGSYDARNSRGFDSDVDFGPANVARASGRDKLRTKTFEARLDTEFSDQFSTLIGLFYSREETGLNDVTQIIPAGLTRVTNNVTKADTYAVFGTLFWNPSEEFELAVGLRYDDEKRSSDGDVTLSLGALTLPTSFTANRLKDDNISPRVTATYKPSDNLSVYGSVARGFRGGGFNAPTAPIQVYGGDNAWTYEIGTKYASPDRTFSVAGNVFYNDYKNYIGLNSIAPAAGGGLVTVDLNSGDVESYGAELEATVRPTPNWTISGGLTYMHARITDDSAYTTVTGRTLSSDRLTFQPDWMGNVSSDYRIDLGKEDSLTLTGGLVYKGERLAATLNQTTPTFLEDYLLVNASIAYRTGPLELSVFANNIFQTDYFDSYIEKTTLQLAGLPASDLGIVGDRRRVGARIRFQF